MADALHSTSRRAMLGAFAVAPLIAVGAIPAQAAAPAAAWARVVDKARRARKKSDAYYRGTCEPAEQWMEAAADREEKSRRAVEIRPIVERSDELAMAAYRAEMAMLAAPAPTAAAILTKVEFYQDVGTDILSDERLEVLAEDLRRLASRETAL